jgi:signal transduction histidine kinase
MAQSMESWPVPCRLVDAKGRVVWRSAALDELLTPVGGTRCCESLGFAHHDADCISLRTVRTGLRQTASRWLGKLYISLDTMPVTAPDGTVMASFEVLRDITAERRLEAAVTRQQELLEATNKAMIEINHRLEDAHLELEEKNRFLEDANNQLRSLDHMKDEFISIVSHELKAPLTSIKGSVELIERFETEKLSPSGQELLTICKRNTVRLHNLVKDLLDIARIESGRLSLAFSRFCAADLFEECFQALKATALEKGLSLENRIPPDLEIEADYDRLMQVAVNLVNNAVKFTDHGGVSAEALVEPGQITLFVSDTGIGIPETELSRIFEKFGQVGSTLHRNSSGTGLGLSIVRGIIREHGGTVSVTSESGQGSRFSLTIPQPPGKVTQDGSSPLD